MSKPGDAPGVLTITGNLTDTQPSELDILLGTQSSQLVVDGTASLLGNLDVDLVDGFSLSSGETFDIAGTVRRPDQRPHVVIARWRGLRG